MGKQCVVFQIHSRGSQPRPILHRVGHPFGKHRSTALATSITSFDLPLMFDHMHLDPRKLKYLPTFIVDGLSVFQRLSAVPASMHRMDLYPIRRCHHAQGCSFMALLTTRLLARWFAHLRNLAKSITGRRLVAVTTVFLQLPFYLTQPLVYRFQILLENLYVALKNSDRILQVFHQGNDGFRFGFIEGNNLLSGELFRGFAFPSHYPLFYQRSKVLSSLYDLSYSTPQTAE
jgi:hypothetical protein